jgi:hypothetical protein
MAAVLIFFVRLATPIFVLLALGLMFGIRRMSQALKEKRLAVFGLEREIANHHMSQAVSTLALVSILAMAEFSLVVFLFPNLPWLAQFATPTMNPLLTQTSTFPVGFMETLGVVTPGDTTATPQATGCIPGQVDLTSPKPGDQIQGLVTLKGTANIPNFGFYKYEFTPVGTDTWATIVANNKPIQDGDLGTWDTSAITPGDYQLRLVVTDNKGSELPACVIPLRIKAP